MRETRYSSFRIFFSELSHELSILFSFKAIIYHIIAIYILYYMFNIETKRTDIFSFTWFLIIFLCVYYFFVSFIILKNVKSLC